MQVKLSANYTKALKEVAAECVMDGKSFVALFVRA